MMIHFADPSPSSSQSRKSSEKDRTEEEENYMCIQDVTQIKFPFKRKACQVYEGGCCRQVCTVVSLVVW